jgi:GT2 family glycosyltransferase
MGRDLDPVPTEDLQVDLSIIVVTYNARDITLETLGFYQSALDNDQQHRYELIVVDNASQDGVDDAIAESFPEAVLIRNTENLGFSAANNIGFTATRGRYILFSNPDIEVSKETLPTLIALMDRDPQVGACTPFLRLVKTGQIDWGSHRGFPTPWAAFTYFVGLSRLFRRSTRLSSVFGRYHLLDRDLSKPHPVDAIRGGFFFVRCGVFEEVGGWDESYFMFGEDLDLCYQIKKLGYEIMFFPQTEALHYHGMTHGLKRHSQDLAPVDPVARDRTYDAFYDAMKIFYEKNYRTKYSAITRQMVLTAIELKKLLGMRRKTV